MLNAPDFVSMRRIFQVKLEYLFVVPAYTFDNVKGKFPIGFQLYDSSKKVVFSSIIADVYDEYRNLIGTKKFSTYDNSVFLNIWLASYKDKTNPIGKLIFNSNDFQHQNRIRITNFETIVLGGDGKFPITKSNLFVSCIYLSVRKVIEATWLNDRDQFLHPNNQWELDTEFQTDCLAYTLFNNAIQSKFGINHWIPFTESEVNAKEKFESNFMTDFIQGKLRIENTGNLFGNETMSNKPLEFSVEAASVFDAGRKLWKYYHSQNGINVNASLYDIREHFQGRNEAGKMNNKSTDETYMNLIGDLREKLKQLADKIVPKVYEYEFLKQ